MHELKFKIITPEANRSLIIDKYATGFFRESYLSTIGVAFYSINSKCKISKGNCIEVVLQVWKVSFNPITSLIRKYYIRGGQGAIIFFDSSQPNTVSEALNCIRDNLN